MAGYWISLPAQWRLEDVQAALNVIITVLSTFGIFIFVRYCWQHAAKRVAHDQDIPLATLLSLNTLGEALDVLFLLKKKLLSSRYLTILAQCVVVICLSSTALLSGVIARYSARQGHVISDKDVPGFLASRQHNGMGYANVEWNRTYARLDEASFPRDQLFDFLPDNSIHWTYEAAEWNNSWSLDCKSTPQTPIMLHDTGNCTGLRYEIPNLKEAFDYSRFANASDYWGYTHKWDGFYNDTDHWKDVLLFIYGWKGWDYQEEGDVSRAMSITLVAIHMHLLPRTDNSSDECNFAVGDVEESSYTGINCELRRQKQVEDPWNVAFPDTHNNGALSSALTEFWQARFAQESTSDSPITVITPPELVRFYQVYHIIKDLQYRQPVTRHLSFDLQVVQLSTVFLTIALLVALLIVIGLAHYLWFASRYHQIMANTPQSKLDWMVQSIQTEDRPLSDTQGRLRRSVTVDSNTGLSGMSSVRRKRSEFEAAKYGGRATTTWFLRDSAATTEYGASPRMDDGEGMPSHHALPQVIHGDKTPMLNVGPTSESYYHRAL
jgi:hypothetical protein